MAVLYNEQMIQIVSDWSVLIINYILRYIVIDIVRNMNYKTFSSESSKTMIFIFLIQFINTSIILLFINADLSRSGIPILDKIFVLGYHSDFTVNWYRDVGKIITSLMIKNISWPIIEFTMWYAYRTLIRIWDKRWCGCCMKGKATRAKTIEEYVEIYSGP
jgi:hypothetical protein